ncbi:MAG: GAF domain-containing protein [Anaerolineae bacterium]
MQTVTEQGRTANEQAVFEAIAVKPETPANELLETMTDALHTHFKHYSGVYIYMVEGDLLVLHHYRGRPTEHVRIPVGEGVCGRAVRIKETVTVDDVTADPDYIMCSLETRSEIVVPILRGDIALGEIDIDSDIPGAFNQQDQLFLEELARRVQARL